MKPNRVGRDLRSFQPTTREESYHVETGYQIQNENAFQEKDRQKVADLHEQECVEMEKRKDPRPHRRRGESSGRDHLFFPETAGRWILHAAGTAAQSFAHQRVLSRVNVGMGAETHLHPGSTYLFLNFPVGARSAFLMTVSHGISPPHLLTQSRVFLRAYVGKSGDETDDVSDFTVRTGAAKSRHPGHFQTVFNDPEQLLP